MGYVSKRSTGRYTGYYYDASGVRRSAGTFDTREEALVRALDAEKSPDHLPAGARQTYAAYVQTWLATETRVMPQTLRGYESTLRKHVLPTLGGTEIGKITPARLRSLFRDLSKAGVSGWTITQAKAAIGSSFKPLVPDVVPVNPTHGVEVDLPPTKPFDLVEEDTFKRISKHLTQPQRLFATFLIVSGARFGEAVEVRVKDINFRTDEVTLMRRVSALGSKRNGGSRFATFDGTKRSRSASRTILLPDGYTPELAKWVKAHELQDDDLVFPKRLVLPTDRPRKRTNTTGHLPNEAWNRAWRAACKASGIGWYPRTHDLRHAYATNLVADGVSIYEVKELLGHSLIETTERYMHRVKSQRIKAAKSASKFLS